MIKCIDCKNFKQTKIQIHTYNSCEAIYNVNIIDENFEHECKSFISKVPLVTKEDLEDLKSTMEYALDKGIFTDNEIEHVYSATCNSSIIIDRIEQALKL